MLFRQTYTARGMGLDREAELKFAYGGAHRITITFSADMNPDARARDALLVASSEFEPSERVRKMFEALAENRLPAGSKQNGRPDYIASDGSVSAGRSIPLRLLPEPFQEFTRQTLSELRGYAERTMRILRWRFAASSDHRPFTSKSREWSLDGMDWKVFPYARKIYSEGIGLIPVPRVNIAEVVLVKQESCDNTRRSKIHS